MPWKGKEVMEKKKDFIDECLKSDLTISELSRRYNISRKTAYKYLNRYKAEGEAGLEERSRAPKNRPKKTSPEVIKAIVDVKLKHLSWGPKKIIARLSKDNPGIRYPSPGTAHYWLNLYGYVTRRKKRLHVPPYTEPFGLCDAPNDIWCIDFKGHFKMGNGKYCYPLTLEDSCSRFLLTCIALDSTNFENVRYCLECVFREFGLPKAIRSDNGEPFASPGRTALTKLSVWFIKLGIRHERIDKGHPEQNGRLERFHRTLKGDIIANPQRDLESQQQQFNTFKYEYNYIRPHEAIDMKTPSEIYHNSIRKYIGKYVQPEYSPQMMVRKIGSAGELYLDWKKYFVSEALIGETVGVKIANGGLIEIYFYDQQILTLKMDQGRICGRKKILYQQTKLKQHRSTQTQKRSGMDTHPARYASQDEYPSPFIPGQD